MSAISASIWLLKGFTNNMLTQGLPGKMLIPGLQQMWLSSKIESTGFPDFHPLTLTGKFYYAGSNLRIPCSKDSKAENRKLDSPRSWQVEFTLKRLIDKVSEFAQLVRG